ncbi:MAG: glycosyltransferase family 39 protein [Anaerolineae bacterium]|nr:glycosyltransferase family 39 protein [Anaerolineae bacterium]
MRSITARITKYDKNYQYFLLIGITLLAGALRFYKLGEWSFWVDEVITINNASTKFGNGFLPNQLVPLSLMLIAPTLNILGVSEWSARLIPTLIGTISIPILYFPIRRIFNPTTALATVLLLAVSPWHIFWSQNARYVSTLILFFTLALLFFYIGLEEDRPWLLGLSLVFIGLAAWERLFALSFVAIILFYIIAIKLLPFEQPPGLRLRYFGWIIPVGIVITLLVAATLLMNPGLWAERFFWAKNSDPMALGKEFTKLITLPIICIGGLATLYLLSQKHRASLLLGAAAIIPIFVIMVFSLFQLVDIRYAVVSLTSWFILAGLAISELSRERSKAVAILTVGVLLILMLAPLEKDRAYYQHEHGNRADWRSALAYIVERRQPGELVVTMKPPLYTYYMHEDAVDRETISSEFIEKQQTKTWFIVYDQPLLRPDLHEWIFANAQLVHQTYGLKIYLYPPVNTYVSEKK